MTTNEKGTELEVIDVTDIKETFELTTPIEIDGKEVSEIEYNLNRITGKTIRIAIQQLGRMEVGVLNLEFSPILHAFLFAFAADIDFHIVEKFNAKDYRRAVEIVSNFM